MRVGDALAESRKRTCDRNKKSETPHVNRFHTAFREIASSFRNWNSASRKLAFQSMIRQTAAHRLHVSDSKAKPRRFNVQGRIEPDSLCASQCVAESLNLKPPIAGRCDCYSRLAALHTDQLHKPFGLTAY